MLLDDTALALCTSAFMIGCSTVLNVQL